MKKKEPVDPLLLSDSLREQLKYNKIVLREAKERTERTIDPINVIKNNIILLKQTLRFLEEQ